MCPLMPFFSSASSLTNNRQRRNTARRTRCGNRRRNCNVQRACNSHHLQSTHGSGLAQREYGHLIFLRSVKSQEDRKKTVTFEFFFANRTSCGDRFLGPAVVVLMLVVNPPATAAASRTTEISSRRRYCRRPRPFLVVVTSRSSSFYYQYSSDVNIFYSEKQYDPTKNTTRPSI